MDESLPAIADQCKQLLDELTRCTTSLEYAVVFNRPDSILQILLTLETPRQIHKELTLECQLLPTIPTHHVQSAEVFRLMFKYYQFKRNSARMLFYAKRYMGLFDELMGGMANRALINILPMFAIELKNMPFGPGSPWTQELLELSVHYFRKILCVYSIMESRGDDPISTDMRNTLVRFLAQLPAEPNKLTECMLCGESPERVAITLNRCGRCGQVAYCSKGCQTAHWKVHKKDCKK
eukprot:gene35412-43663_t